MLEKDITEKRLNRHKITQEDFTPPEIVDELLYYVDNDLFTDFKKTFCDPSVGIGNIICEVIKRRLTHCNNTKDIYNALSTLYGTELMEDNTEECKKNILMTVIRFTASNDINIKESKVMEILDRNIVCTDAFKWDYENWKPLE